MRIKFINTETNKQIKELNQLQFALQSLDQELMWANKNASNSEIKKLLRKRKEYSFKFDTLKEKLVKIVLLGG